MKKRIISLMCTVVMILSAIFVAPSSAFAEETYDFSDSYDTWTQGIEKVGEWDIFPNHPDFGLSVVGRKNTNSENGLIYSFEGKKITAVSVDVVEHHIYFKKEDLVVSAYSNGAWHELSLTMSAEKEIDGAKNPNFKSVTATAVSVPVNTTKLKLQLNNSVAWTLFLDRLKVSGASEVDKAYNEQTLFFTNSSGTTLEYYLTVPAGYDGKETLPLVLFMHGFGGDTDRSGYRYFRDKVFKNNYNCILLAPIADRSKGQHWRDRDAMGDVGATAIYNQDDLTPTPALLAARDLLKKVKSTYNVDSSRIYAIGYSMGGFGTYELATRYPELFSAIAPICGGCDPTKASVIKDLPIWSFHGTADAVVNIDANRAMYENLLSLGNKNAHYTEYDGLDHGIWFKAMDDVTDWLFKQSKNTDFSENTAYKFDSLTDWNISSAHTDGLEIINQPNIKDIVVSSKTSNYVENYIEYSCDGRELSEVVADTGFRSDFAAPEYLILKAQTDDSDVWHTVKATAVLSTPIGDSKYTLSKLSYMGLPKNTKRIRISVKNDAVNWTYFINNVAIKYKEDPVQSEPAGDFNNDGSVNILDLIILKKHMANEKGDLKFDLDGDDLIDAKDIAALRKHLLGAAELLGAEKVENIRKINELKKFADNDLIFLSGLQLESGAFPTRADTKGAESINPYFSDYVAIALLNRPDLYAENVKKYINWHFAHLNADGTIYDYYMDGKEEKTNGTYDSTDSYAATFLMLLEKYCEKTGDIDFITEHKSNVISVYNSMISTLHNGLTYAKEDYPIIYTMDNSEVYVGLIDSEKLFKLLDENNLANDCLEKSSQLKTELNKQLWNENCYFETGINKDDGTVSHKYLLNEYYPSGLAQLFPVIYNAVDTGKKMSVYYDAKRRFDIGSVAAKEDYYCFVALAAASVGDVDYLIQYKNKFSAAVPLGNSTVPYVAIVLNSVYEYAATVN